MTGIIALLSPRGNIIVDQIIISRNSLIGIAGEELTDAFQTSNR